MRAECVTGSSTSLRGHLSKLRRQFSPSAPFVHHFKNHLNSPLPGDALLAARNTHSLLPHPSSRAGPPGLMAFLSFWAEGTDFKKPLLCLACLATSLHI